MTDQRHLKDAVLAVGDDVQAQMIRIRHLVQCAAEGVEHLELRNAGERHAMTRLQTFLEMVEEASETVDGMVGKLLEVDFEAMPAA
jgi:chromosome condensin MukBEF complex kleisin-like MukF subunit